MCADWPAGQRRKKEERSKWRWREEEGKSKRGSCWESQGTLINGAKTWSYNLFRTIMKNIWIFQPIWRNVLIPNIHCSLKICLPHSSINMPILKSMVAKKKNGLGKQLSLMAFAGCYHPESTEVSCWLSL